ncbi:MAG: SDR family NAD(P)-dependent oxidoreductase [Bacteroidales bacterium]|nr:SDR family NAD(P)-dependent oxidoreductase [Bacteroidales bacterium]
MKKVIIFGASSGIGKMLAQQYAVQGCMVAVAARRVENLKELQKTHPVNIIVFRADLSAVPAEMGGELQESPRGKFREMVEALGGVDLVIYCSGVGKQNAQLEIQLEYSTINVNVTGFTAIAAAVVEYGSTAGHHVQFATISSIASTRGIGISASYSATKMYQVRYMESLRQLSNSKGWNMSFTTILPGFIATDFIKGRNYPMTMQLPYASRQIKQAIDARKNTKIIDWKWTAVVAFWRLIPNWLWYKIKVG